MFSGNFLQEPFSSTHTLQEPIQEQSIIQERFWKVQKHVLLIHSCINILHTVCEVLLLFIEACYRWLTYRKLTSVIHINTEVNCRNTHQWKGIKELDSAHFWYPALWGNPALQGTLTGVIIDVDTFTCLTRTHTFSHLSGLFGFKYLHLC